MNPERPATSKARGICRYYLTPRGCFAGKDCKFLHGEQENLTPYDKNKTCRFYASGFCKRGADCWFIHARAEASGFGGGSGGRPTAVERKVEDKDDHLCYICYEKPVTYGLLGGCSHIFCLDCIKTWRDRKGKSEEVISSGVIKMCPLCRATTKFVTPSSVFYTQDDPRKTIAIAQYKASMARVPCRFFQRSPSEERYCPFGNDCFYQHLNEDGTPYEFGNGVDYYMRRRGKYLDADGVPLGRSRPSLLQGLQDALDRIMTSLEGIPRIGDIPEASLDADDVLSEADIRFSDDGTSLVSPSLVTALAESVMSSIAAFAGEGVLASRPRPVHQLAVQPSLQDEQPDNNVAPTERTLAERLDDPRGGTWRLLSPSSRSEPADEPYEALSRAGISTQSSPAIDTPAATLEEEILLDYGTVEQDSTHSAAHQVPTAPTEVPASEGLPFVSALPLSRSTPHPSFGHEPPSTAVASVSSAEEPADEATSAVAPEVVYDSDPPFRTDGRGRVVWSSATASTRSRKTRSSGAPPPAPLCDESRDIAPTDYVAGLPQEPGLVV